MLRLTRTFQAFDVLHLLVQSLLASFNVLRWSLLLLCMIMVMTSLLASFALEDHMRGSGEKREVVFEYFGTFTRSFLSLFEVSLGNWAPIARLLHENVSEYFLPFILLYLSVVVF